MNKKMGRVLFLFLILFLLVGGGVVSAQTPDGETPAVETVCDGQSGAAFGLCNVGK